MLAKPFVNMDENSVILGENALWHITDKSLENADEWVNDINKYADEKAKSKNTRMIFTAFRDPYTKKPLELIIPTFAE